MPPTSVRTAWRARACIRTPPSAGSDSTAVRCCRSVSTSRYRPSSSRRGSSVRPIRGPTRAGELVAQPRQRGVDILATSGERLVHDLDIPGAGDLSAGGSRSLNLRATSGGEAGSATRPTWIGFIARMYPLRAASAAHAEHLPDRRAGTHLAPASHTRSASLLIGLPQRYPCPAGQPSSCSMSRCACVSIPSAMAGMSSSRQRAITLAQIVRSIPPRRLRRRRTDRSSPS